jgi:hypothetical protein
MANRKEYSYDVDDDWDRAMVLDQPFSSLNKKGRRAKKKFMRTNKIF